VVETPLVFGYGLGDLGFEGSDGEVGLAEVAGEGFEGVAVFFGHGEYLAGEAVVPAMEGGADFAFGGFGAGGFLGVAPVCFDLFWVAGMLTS
jgi:hypothetical protein